MVDNAKKELRRSNGPGIVILVLFTLFIGFFLGLLFAPEKGSKFRKELVARIKEILDRTRFSFVEARVMGEGIIEKSWEKVEEVSSKLRSRQEEDTEE